MTISPLVTLALLASGSAFGATIEVDTQSDALDSAGDCSLREAIIAANQNIPVDGCAAGDPVAIAVDQILVPAGTYVLERVGSDETWKAGVDVDPYDVDDQPDTTIGDLDVLESAHFLGDGSGVTTIGWASQQDRIFHVAAVGADDVQVELTGLTIRGGHVPAEVVNPGDPPELQWSLRRLGGGIAVGPGASMKLEGTSGSDEGNSGPPDVHVSGGDPSLALADVVIDGNSSDGDAGGLFSGGALTASDVVFSNNTCAGNGGGLYHEGDLDMSRSAFLDNSAEGGGAAFMTGGTSGTIDSSLVRGNYATGGGGFSARSLVVIDVVNTTIAENEAFDVGGGMYTNGTFRLDGCSVVDNLAGGDAGFGGGGLHTFSGGQYDLENTLLAGNSTGALFSNCGCSGGSCVTTDTFSSNGYNLEDVDTCAFDQATDLSDTDPMITALGAFGGPLDTYALIPGSPAIDAGALSCQPFDQRGAMRAADGDGDGTAHCDIGAFELDLVEIDNDNDGYCEGLDLDGVLGCADGSLPGDCADAEALSFPGNPEVCDGIDNDCAYGADDGLLFEDWFADSDADGFGDATMLANTCDGPPMGYVADATDCDDTSDIMYPGNPEVCDGIDNDCANGADDGLLFEDWFADGDGDGFGDATMLANTCDGPPVGYVADATDCDDTSDAVHPDAIEVCNAGVDDDCSGLADDEDPGVDAASFDSFWLDSDQDGFGAAAQQIDACVAPSGYITDNTDCDDTASDVNPDAVELCNDIDDDCDTLIDDADDSVEPTTTFYADGDGDGYGDPGAGELACLVPDGSVADDTDCDDGDSAVHPGAEEIKNDIDDDCDGLVDKDDKDDYTGGCGCSQSTSTGGPAALLTGLFAVVGMRRRR